MATLVGNLRGPPGVTDVWVGPDAPTDPNVTLWYDPDAVLPPLPAEEPRP